MGLDSKSSRTGDRPLKKRNHRIERTEGSDEYVTADGQKVEVAYSGCELTVSEWFCEHCEKWVEVRGVLGALRFLGTHDSGECPEEPEGGPGAE